MAVTSAVRVNVTESRLAFALYICSSTLKVLYPFFIVSMCVLYIIPTYDNEFPQVEPSLLTKITPWHFCSMTFVVQAELA